MPPKHAWSVLASRSLIDRDSNNINLDVLEQIQPIGASADQAIAYPFELVSLWYRTLEGEQIWRYRIRVLNPSGDWSPPTVMSLDLSQYARLRTRVRFLSITVANGTYFFVVELESEVGSDEWEEVARIPLQMVLAPEHQGA